MKSIAISLLLASVSWSAQAVDCPSPREASEATKRILDAYYDGLLTDAELEARLEAAAPRECFVVRLEPCGSQCADLEEVP